MNTKIKLLTTLILATLPFSSYSRVYEYTIKDIYGAEKSVSAETGILNTNEKIQLSLISGLDRKVHVSVRKDGTEVYGTTTDSIKVSDRIKASTGEEFYGKIITLPPLSDGPYQVISEILNTQDIQVDSTTQVPIRSSLKYLTHRIFRSTQPLRISPSIVLGQPQTI
ncbi:DUF4165 domain-containing protein (plasmid) [Escherichia coli]